jgi:hypothetical protein
MASSRPPGCGATSPRVGNVRSHCVLPHGHRGRHSWETVQGRKRLQEAAQESARERSREDGEAR